MQKKGLTKVAFLRCLQSAFAKMGVFMKKNEKIVDV